MISRRPPPPSTRVSGMGKKGNKRRKKGKAKKNFVSLRPTPIETIARVARYYRFGWDRDAEMLLYDLLTREINDVSEVDPLGNDDGYSPPGRPT